MTKKKQKYNASPSSFKQLTVSEMREWYTKHESVIEKFERNKNAMQLLDPTKTNTKIVSTFSKESLRTYMKNPLSQYKNLRSLSRFLYYRSQTYRRLINYNASMINLNYRSVIPMVDIIKGVDKKKMIKSYYETLVLLEKMNLQLEFYKVYVTCFKEDVFYGCAYLDDDGFFLLPLDPDYCKVTGMYPDGSLAFNMNMSYFDQKKDILEMWGSPFNEMYNAYEKDKVKGKWQPMPDENCVCLKYNIDEWETPIPVYIGLFDSLINLEDLKEITAIADEQQIYKLLMFTVPLLQNSSNPDDFAVDIATAVEYYNLVCDMLPDYTNAAISLLPVEAITFDSDQSTDVNKIEQATKSVLSVSGGANVLCSANISGSTSWLAAIKSDEEFAFSSLLPQTEAVVNRLISYKIKDAAKVKFLEVTRYTAKEYKELLIKDATYGEPTKIEINTLNGFTELETISKAYLEDALGISELFMPLKSSNTMNTGEMDAGRPENKTDDITEDGEKSKDKRENNN